MSTAVVGQSVTSTVTFVPASGSIEADECTVVVTRSDGTTFSPTITEVFVNTFTITFTIGVDGPIGAWTIVWDGEDPAISLTDVLVVTRSATEDLVTRADLALYCGTQDAASAVQEAALTQAISHVEDYLDRQLRRQQVTQTLETNPSPSPYGGRAVWPKLYPIVEVTATSQTIAPHRRAIYNVQDSTPVGLVAAYQPPTATVTFTGGYLNSTLPTPLKMAICRVAAGICQVQTTGTLPEARKIASKQLGDARVQYENSGDSAEATILETFAPGVTPTIRGYRRSTRTRLL